MTSARVSWMCGPALLLASLLRCRPALAGALLSLLSVMEVLLLVWSSPPAPEPIAPHGTPIGVALDSATGRLYVGAFSPNAVWTLDARNRRVLGTLDLGAGFINAMAVNPATAHLYIASWPEGITVIAEATNTVLTTVPLPQAPTGIAINPVTNRVYVAARAVGQTGAAGALIVLDGERDTVVADVPAGLDPLGVAVNPRTNRVYVANPTSDTVTVLDGGDNTVLGSVAVGRFPSHVAVNARTNRLYVGNRDSATVSVLDGASGAVLATVSTGQPPGELAVDEATDRVYVAHGADAVTILDGATNRALTTLRVGSYPAGIAVDPATHTAYVADLGDNTLWAIRARHFGPPTARLTLRTVPQMPSPVADPCSCALPPLTG